MDACVKNLLILDDPPQPKFVTILAAILVQCILTIQSVVASVFTLFTTVSSGLLHMGITTNYITLL